MEERKIGTGTSCILVKDVSLLQGWSAPLYQWLKDEGFISWRQKGTYDGVDWIYINITSKVYAPGMPGIGITQEICGHAVTLDEFMTIYNIFKKYKGLDALRMSQKEQVEWNERIKSWEQSKNKGLRNKMTLEEYRNKIIEKCKKHPIVQACPKDFEKVIAEWDKANLFEESYNNNDSIEGMVQDITFQV